MRQGKWQHRLAAVVATGMGSGLAPVAPGTFGSVMGLGMYAFGYMVLGVSGWLPWMLASVIAYLIGYWATTVVSHEWGHDPGKIVIDEIVGVWITVAIVPFTWTHLLIGFALFRFFDIVKPLGVGWIDGELGGAASVMLDDVLAGIYAGVVLYAFYYFSNV